MGKYYYSDPLEAAYMAKHYEMNFVTQDGEELKWCGEFSCYYTDAHLAAWEERFYLSPDSLNILEPQEGDICLYPKQEISLGKYSVRAETWHEPTQSQIRFGAGFGILYRNNKPFFWPEIE